MEKRRPHYDLNAVKTAMGSVDTLSMSMTARRGALGLGFDASGVVSLVQGMNRAMFKKSMTTYADHRVWQDVYHLPVSDLVIYINSRPTPSPNSRSSPSRKNEMVAERILPKTMTSPDTGELLVRGIRPYTVEYKGHSITVDQPGYYNPNRDDDGVFVGKDMEPSDQAFRLLRERVDGLPSPATIKEIRAKLKLSQREAGTLFRVGENAFDKYERGLVEPSGPTIQLMKLLERHPDLIEELR